MGGDFAEDGLQVSSFIHFYDLLRQSRVTF